MSGQAADVNIPAEQAAVHSAPSHAANEPPANEDGLAFLARAESYMKTRVGLLEDYQIDGVAKMIVFEEGPRRGGILADEAGLGTILQCLILIAAGKGAGQKSPTLIVAPNDIVVNAWKDEISQFTCDLSTIKYHGGRREQINPGFDKADIVLTTYDTAQRDLPPAAHQKIKVERNKSPTSRKFYNFLSEHLTEMGGGNAIFKQHWNRVIFDQAQWADTPHSHTHSSLKCHHHQRGSKSSHLCGNRNVCARCRAAMGRHRCGGHTCVSPPTH